MRVYRLLVYEGPAEALDKLLGYSLPDGLKVFGAAEAHMSIRVITLPFSFDRLIDSIANTSTTAEGS